MGADASVLNAIRDKPLTQGYKRESYYIYTHKYLYIFIQSLFIHSPTIYFKHIMLLCHVFFAYIDMYHFTYQNSPQVYIKCTVRIRMHEEIIEMKEKQYRGTG